MSDDDETVLEGIVDRVAFSNPDSGFAVIKLDVPGRDDTTAVGILSGVRPGEYVRVVGRWEQDTRFGEQLRAETWVPVEPTSVAGVEKYLGSGLVDGIGPVMAKRLVASFGAKTLEVIEHEPHRLTEVDGIGPKRREKIVAAWKTTRAVHEVMVFLQSHQVSPSHAARIYRVYGADAVRVVRDNPYRLAYDIRGIGFSTADRIAASIGFDRSSPERVEAGTLHVVSQRADDGDVLVHRETLHEQASALLDVEPQAIVTALASLNLAGHVVIDGDEIFRTDLHEAESTCVRRLHDILAAPRRALAIEADDAIRDLESQEGLQLAEAQREAIEASIADKLIVITGGPGTGKTTVVNAIIKVLSLEHQQVTLCAPTGRAAKRLQQTTGREARTIHRLLEISPRENRFLRDENNPLQLDMLVADEASMIDVVLFSHLLRALPDEAKLVLVGDEDQLPSVGPGRILADVIESGRARVVRLNHIFRQAHESLIVDNAHRINGGELPRSSADREGDFFFFEREEPEEVLETIKTLVGQRVPRGFGFDPIDDVQVLTPMHKGTLGAMNLNAELQALLNPRGDAVVRGNRILRVGDKVMQTRNDYERDVFNGDLGRVHAIDTDERTVSVLFDGRVVNYELKDLDALVLAYACSIHKSQGSEYPAVVLPVHTQHYVMLRRNLLYTAVTRGKQLVILVGNRRALRLSVANDRAPVRRTALARRLRDE